MIWDTAYLINLPERKERLEYALWELRNVSIEPIIIPAIVLKDRELACKTSHLNIMKMVLKENKENEKLGIPGINPLIIEDDLWIQGIVDISKDLQVTKERTRLKQQSIDNFWQKIGKYDNMLDVIEEQMGGWDIFFFYSDARFINSRISILNKKINNESINVSYIGDHIIVRQKIDDDSDCLLEGPTYCTHFYVINKNSLEKVIDRIEKDPEGHAIDKIFIKNSIKKEMNLEKEFALKFKYKNQIVTDKLKIYCTSQNIVCQCINFQTSIPANLTHTWNGNLNGIFQQRW